MTRGVVLLLLLPWQGVPGRPYHKVALERLVTSQWTHVEVCGPVVYRRKMKDGDWHITLDNGKGKVVVEIIPAIPLDPPRKGAIVRVWGISRMDRDHGWPEVHPAERIAVVERC
jgi:hypothetical protein